MLLFTGIILSVARGLISIFDDRIEFVTIGGLVKGITLDDVKLGVSVLRNQHLANIFYRLRLIEAYGTGILKINECYEDDMVKPVIQTTDNAFKITLPNRNFVTEDQEFQHMERNSRITIPEKKRKTDSCGFGIVAAIKGHLCVRM